LSYPKSSGEHCVEGDGLIADDIWTVDELAESVKAITIELVLLVVAVTAVLQKFATLQTHLDAP
jgi:hypothetical protein